MSLITRLFPIATGPGNGFLGWQMILLKLTTDEDAPKFTVAPIVKLHSEVLFWKHFKFFQVLKCLVCFVITACEKQCRHEFCHQWHCIPMLLKNT